MCMVNLDKRFSLTDLSCGRATLGMGYKLPVLAVELKNKKILGVDELPAAPPIQRAISIREFFDGLIPLEETRERLP